MKTDQIHFPSDLPSHSAHLDGDVLDLLSSLGDFVTFSEAIGDFSRAREVGILLEDALTVTQIRAD